MWHVWRRGEESWGEEHECVPLVDVEARGHFEELGVDERIMLKWIFKKLCAWTYELDWSGSGQEQETGYFKCGDESSGSKHLKSWGTISSSRRTPIHGFIYWSLNNYTRQNKINVSVCSIQWKRFKKWAIN